MEDLNLVDTVRKVPRSTWNYLIPMRALRTPVTRRILVGFVAAVIAVRVLKLDTVEVDMGSFPPLTSEIMPAAYDPARALDVAIREHPFRPKFVVTFGFGAVPHPTHGNWTYNRWTRRLIITSADYGDGERYATEYHGVTDAVIHARAKGGRGGGLESYGATRGGELRPDWDGH